MVLQDKSIKAVLVTKNHDDKKFFNRAMDVVKNIMKKQSTDVDTVSGATYSSRGIMNAVNAGVSVCLCSAELETDRQRSRIRKKLILQNLKKR